MKQDERCTRCGGEIFPNAGEQWPDGWIHSEPNNCYLTASARAEAAEAEAARLRDENAEAWFAFDRQQSRGDRLAARVAELEAQLAAQQWRPIDEPAPKGEIEVKMRCAVTDDGGIYKIRTDIFVGWWTSADDSEWRPLPPAPQEPEKPS